MANSMFKRVLIANRGEIALRISRALRELGVEVCIVHGREDRLSLPVRFSDYRELRLRSAVAITRNESLIQALRFGPN